MKILLLFSLLLFSISYGEDLKPWQLRRSEGWAWYQDFKKPKDPLPKNPCLQDPLIVLQEAKEQLERSLAAAMVNPSEENVIHYMTLQKKWIAQSAKFSELWQKALLMHPELAHLSPTTQMGVQVKKEIERKQTKALLEKLTLNHLLLFFYEGANPYSQNFAKVVQEFIKQYSWQVKAIAVDGIKLASFPNSISNNDLTEEMGIHFFPSLFLVNKKTLQGVPIAFNLVTVSQIEENIRLQFTPQKECFDD